MSSSGLDMKAIFYRIVDYFKKLPLQIITTLRAVSINHEVKRYALNLSVLGLSVFISLMMINHIPEIRKMIISANGKNIVISTSENDSIKAIRVSLEKSLAKLQTKTNAYTPTSPYVVVNTSLNEFWLYKNRKLLINGKCSTGSYIQLEGSNKKWIFKTPRGEFWIHGKTTSPVWKKPDWAFVEEGMPVPSGDHPSRYEYGVLGDYALSIGQGYLIHGTLYKRYLGAAVTHGCIRLNDEDLEKVYQTLNISSKVYIY